ncbi:Filament-like plant protein 7 [Quillaja saponaria]|uniref:Filament-like plant protein 7 n=1 Tax=Quillaja saponaria TaxID=32244 RepID=A0AAD7M055_QUISA|nr:Filament-like plant protein 7 [Quillaja saponaria]
MTSTEIMDQKIQLWRKRSMEKTTFAADKAVNPSPNIEEEIRTLRTDKDAGLDQSAENLKEKLASVLIDHHIINDPSTKHAKVVQDDMRGDDKAESEAESLKEMNEHLEQGIAANERLTHLDAKSKELLKQINSVQEEKEQWICDAVKKMSREHKKVQKELEEKLKETYKGLADKATENANLNKALLAKEKLIEDLHKCNSQSVAEFSTLMARLDSTEKENAFLKYEFHMLEKELEIRKEEMDYSRRYAETSHKQYLESVEKITKLESECQRLCLMQKRPAAFLNVKSEVGIKGREKEMRRRMANSSRDLVIRNNTSDNSPQVSNKRISLHMKQLQDMDEENKTLKGIIAKKNTELSFSRIMYSQTASQLAQAETKLRKLSESQKSMQLARCGPLSNELPLSSNFDIGSGDGMTSSGSWATALISELEHFRYGKFKNQQQCKAIEIPDMSLMDDFVEMEKLAIVSVEAPEIGYSHDLTGKELVPVEHDHIDSTDRSVKAEKSFDWLQVVLNAIMEQKRMSKRSLDELFEDLKIALGYMNHPAASKADTIQNSRHPVESNPLNVSNYITWKSPNNSPVTKSVSGVSITDTKVEEKSSEHSQSNLSESICRIIKLIEGLNPMSVISKNCPGNCSENQNSNISPSAASREYFIHVFQWKVSELNPILQEVIQTCNDLLTGDADLEKFAEEVAFALDWIMNNYATPKDTSIARDKIKKHFNWNESQCDIEHKTGVVDPPMELDILHTFDKQSTCSPPLGSSLQAQNDSLHKKNNHCVGQDESGRLLEDLTSMESAKKGMDVKLFSTITDKSEDLIIQLREAEMVITRLKAELQTLEESKGLLEDQIEKQKQINEDHDTQLTIVRAKLNEVFQKFSSLEVELEDKNNCCEDLEVTCLELQLQLESIANKESPNYSAHEVEKHSQNDWEITTASVKLAECQETILNLGKQLKALASSSEEATFDRIISTIDTASITNKKNLIKHSSLRHRMQAEDDAKAVVLKSCQIRDTSTSIKVQRPAVLHSGSCNTLQAPNVMQGTPETTNLASKQNDGIDARGALAVVPSKKQGGLGFLKKLLLRRKKGNGKRIQSLTKA